MYRRPLCPGVLARRLELVDATGESSELLVELGPELGEAPVGFEIPVDEKRTRTSSERWTNSIERREETPGRRTWRRARNISAAPPYEQSYQKLWTCSRFPRASRQPPRRRRVSSARRCRTAPPPAREAPSPRWRRPCSWRAPPPRPRETTPTSRSRRASPRARARAPRRARSTNG